MQDAGLSDEQLAQEYRISRSLVQQWGDPNVQRWPRADHIARGRQRYRRRWVRALASIDGDVVLPAPVMPHDPATLQGLTARRAVSLLRLLTGGDMRVPGAQQDSWEQDSLDLATLCLAIHAYAVQQRGKDSTR